MPTKPFILSNKCPETTKASGILTNISAKIVQFAFLLSGIATFSEKTRWEETQRKEAPESRRLVLTNNCSNAPGQAIFQNFNLNVSSR